MKSGRIGIAIHAPRADLPHQIHAHGVAAQRKKGRMPQAQNAAVTPDQIDRQRQHPVTEILADQSDAVRPKGESAEDAGTTWLRMGTAMATTASTARNHVPPRSLAVRFQSTVYC